MSPWLRGGGEAALTLPPSVAVVPCSAAPAGWEETASLTSLGTHTWDCPSTYRSQCFRSTQPTTATSRTPPYLCLWSRTRQQHFWNTRVCQCIFRRAEWCRTWHLNPPPCPSKLSMSLQKLGTVGRTQSSFIYVSTARCASPSMGLWGQVRSAQSWLNGEDRWRGMGERSTCRAMISQSRAAPAMGYTAIPWQTGCWGKCKMEGSARKSRKS